MMVIGVKIILVIFKINVNQAQLDVVFLQRIRMVRDVIMEVTVLITALQMIILVLMFVLHLVIKLIPFLIQIPMELV